MLGVSISRSIAALALIAVILAVLFFFVPNRETEPIRQSSLSRTDVSTASPSEPVAPISKSAVIGEEMPGAIMGTVQWFETKEPAQGVPVIAEAEGRETLETMTDDSGAFVFEEVPPDVEFTLRAHGGVGGPYTVKSLKARVGVNQLLDGQALTVWRGQRISGAVFRVDPVIDIRDGVPVAGGLQALENAFRTPPPEKTLPGIPIQLIRVDRAGSERTVAETTTDRDGQFQFPLVPSGPYVVHAVAPPDAVVQPAGKRRDTASVHVAPELPPPDFVKFVFNFDSLGLEGRVIDDRGQPIAGARVKAEQIPPPDGGESWLGAVEATTDAKGKYTLHGLASASISHTMQYMHGAVPSNAYTVTAVAEGFAPRRIAVPMVTAPMVSAVQGVIEDLTRRYPVAAQQAAEQRQSSKPNPVPDSQGRVIKVPDLQLERAATIAGRVVDTADRLLRDVGIEVQRVPWQDIVFLTAMPGPPPTRLQTSNDGQFRISSLPGGTYQFFVNDYTNGIYEAVRGSPLKVEAGEVLDDVTLVIAGQHDRGAIRGRVVDAGSGAPIEKFDVRITRIDSVPNEPSPTYGARSSEEMAPGTFLIQRVSPGRAELQVSATGFPSHWRAVDVVAGSETELVVEIQPGAAIEGRVTRNGVAVEHSYISARRIDARFEYQQAGVSSETDGVYRFESLEPAEYLMTASYSLSRSLDRHAHALVLLGAGEIVRVDFQIDGDGRIEGTLTLPAGFDYGVVLVRDARDAEPVMVDGELNRRFRSIASAKLGQTGPYTIEALPPGDYSVVGLAVHRTNEIEDEYEYAYFEKTVTVRDGSSVRVDLAIP